MPAATEAATRVLKAFAAGEVSYLFVLESNRQLLQARLRQAEAKAEVQRAQARMKHSTGFYQEKQ